MEFSDRVPIYYQIKQYLYEQIITKHLLPGEQLPAVRQLAVDLTVNANTVQRALSELIQEGVIIPQRGRGNFVTKDQATLAELKDHVVDAQLAWLYDHLAALELTPSQMQAAFSAYVDAQQEDDHG